MIISVDAFLTKLAFQHLKNTDVVSDKITGVINPDREEGLVELLNQGLVDISTRMKLFETTVALPIVEGTNIYDITLVNFVRVLEVQAVQTGRDVIEANVVTFTPKSDKHITLPSPSTIRFTNHFIENYGPSVDLKMQTTHPTVAVGGDISLPPHLFEALILYVSGLYLSQKGNSEDAARGDNYYGLYLSMLNSSVTNNSAGTSETITEYHKFHDRGFV